MLRNYFINKEWLLSPTARQVYRAAAIMTFVLLLMLTLLRLTGQVPESLVPWVKLFLFLGVLGTAVTMIGMEYFLFSLDSSSALAKAFWFCLMLLPLLGPTLVLFYHLLASRTISEPRISDCGLVQRLAEAVLIQSAQP